MNTLQTLFNYYYYLCQCFRMNSLRDVFIFIGGQFDKLQTRMTNNVEI